LPRRNCLFERVGQRRMVAPSALLWHGRLGRLRVKPHPLRGRPKDVDVGALPKLEAAARVPLPAAAHPINDATGFKLREREATVERPKLVFPAMPS